jgi:hypothetical protein
MPSGTTQGQERYRGPLGATRREHVHVACPCGAHHSVEVVVGLDCQADPALARRLLGGELLGEVSCPATRQRRRIPVPLVYHDPVNQLFALVLHDADRWRELSERARLYHALAEATAHPVPRYVAEFAVVYGPDGLRQYVERRAERALGRARRGRAASPDRKVSPPKATESDDLITAEQPALTQVAVPRSEPIVSDAEPVASGTIGASGAGEGARSPVSQLDDEALVAALGHRERRMEAAIELARRGERGAVAPVFAALAGMSRAEAGRVLGSVVGFGRNAEPYLMAELGSRKSYLRQGAALALAVLGSEAGLEAICDRLLDEPTELWREIARALGETGESAVMPLVARLPTRPDSVRERAAWALAHLAARGASGPVEALAAGRDPIGAGVARHALELTDLARSDHLQVRGDRPPRDQTVNRAFSRQFFAAMAAEAAPTARITDMSGPAMLLDESDVLEAVEVDGEEAALDEGDLMPT